MMISKEILSSRLLPRKALNQIKKYLDDEHIILIVGSRQTGKTSLLYLLMKHLLEKRIPEDRLYYINLEDFDVLEMCNRSVNDFITYLKGLGADISARNYVFIDEIQYLDEPTHFLKYLFDTHQTLKLFVTGSSSLEIRRKFKDSLAGRKVIFELMPLDFSEFLLFNNESELSRLIDRHSLRQIIVRKTLDDFPPQALRKKIMNYYTQFVIFGGYPRIVIEDTLEKKMVFLNELVQAYVRKDIKDMMRIDNILAFNNLLKMLALQIGNLVNYSELAGGLTMARETVERYLFILENTFIIKTVYPYFTNRRKEVVKMPKIYFLDTGLRNTLLKNYQDLSMRPDAGSLIENTVFTNLYKNAPILEEIHFWRTQSKNEVDFVLLENEPKPIEVKFGQVRPSLTSGLRSFTKNYDCKQAVLLTQDKVKIERVEELDTFTLPVWTA